MPVVMKLQIRYLFLKGGRDRRLMVHLAQDEGFRGRLRQKDGPKVP